jgi:two-component system, NtrC family, response regulator HydG
MRVNEAGCPGSDRALETAPTARTRAPVSIVERTRAGVVTLHPLTRDMAPQTWVTGQETTIGRSRSCGIRLADERVSRHHAKLERLATGFLVRDCGSQHGTFVNGQLASREGVRARFGSILRIGETLLALVDDAQLHSGIPRRLSGQALGLSGELLAGPALSGVWDQAARVALLGQPILVLGESGTGKECVARIVHASVNPRGPFVGVNLAAIPDGLFEAELFGHERGAFTGATLARPGAFREASGGLLFLDEIGDMNPSSQAKLLRAIDLQVVRPLGARCEVPVQVRLVAATSVDLEAAAKCERFRADLFYRISELVIRIPPLRERPGDVLAIAHTIVSRSGSALRLSTEAAERLVLASLPGNVRSLRALVTQAIARTLTAKAREISGEYISDDRLTRGSDGSLSEQEIRVAMQASAGVVSKAAQLLRVSRTTFYNSCKRLNIEPSALVE